MHIIRKEENLQFKLVAYDSSKNLARWEEIENRKLIVKTHSSIEVTFNS